MTRVVISGLGAASPMGLGVKAFWDGVRTGVCAIRPATLVATAGLRCELAAEVPDPLPGSSRRSRADRLALVAAAEALADAGLTAAERAETALVVGAVGGGMYEAEAWYWRHRRGQSSLADGRPPLRAILPFAHAETLGHVLRVHGPRQTIVAACSSGAAAVACAADLVRDGVVPVVLAGGVDAITRLCFLGFNALRLLDPEPCRPFDRARRGMSIGEGAGFVVVEDAAHARARGAGPYAELVGAGMTTDAHHVTSPDPSGAGMVRAMRGALAQARLTAADIGYANAHGTGTPQNDRIEGRALACVFGEGGLLVSSSKSMIGHTMAAAGGLEAIATVLALVHETVPPTAGLHDVDPAVPFDCVAGSAREVRLGAAISNSFGFGGQNVCLLFRRP